MDNNWIIDNLNYAFGVWNDKLTEMWSLLTQSPQAFKGGTIWQTIQTVNGAMQGISYGLLVLFLAIGIFRSSASFRDFQRPEHVLRHFIYFVMAKLAVTYGIDLMVDIFTVCAGIISAAAGSGGDDTGADRENVHHQVDAVGNSQLRHDEVDKMPQDVFRPLEVPKAGAAAEDANGQKQHQQTVTDALHGSIDGLNRLPDGAALKRLGRLGQQRPHLR